MSDYKSPFIDTPLGEYFEVSPKGIAFPLQKKAILDDHLTAEDSSLHENHCGEFTDNFEENKTNFDKLVKDLSKNKNNPYFIFNWSKYGSQRYTYTPYRVSVKDIDFNRDVPKSEKTLHHTSFEYNLDGKTISGSFNRARLNKRICSLDSNRSHRITINPNKKKIEYVLSFYYSNTQKYRNPVKETIEDNDFSIQDKFRAIELYTDNVNHFVGFIESIDKRSTIKKSIEDAFKEAYKRINSDSALDWFYEKAPSYVIKNHKKDVLWNDLIKLLKFDERKWFIDSSNAMIKVLEGIASKNDGIEYLYDKFYANPRTVKEIYHFLDKSGTTALYGDILVPNKTVFASLLMQISTIEVKRRKGKLKYKRTSEGSTSQATFYLTKGYRIDSNVKVSNDKYYDAYDLTQEKFISRNRQITSYPTGGGTGKTINTKEEYFEAVGETQYLLPLDIVTLVIAGENGKDTAIEVPAIFVKDLAHQREWEEIMEIIRVGADILAIILGVATFFLTGNPFFIALAIADIGVAGFDLYVQAKKDEYMKDDAGRAFLQQWETIYNTVGLGIAVLSLPSLVRSTLGLGLSIYRGATGATKEFLRIAIFKIILETNIHNFTGNTFKEINIGIHIFARSKIKFNIGALERLQDKGVHFVGLIDQSGEVTDFMAIYKAEIIAQGTAKEVRNTLKKVWNLKGKKLESQLDILEQTVKLEDNRIGYVDGLFDAIDPSYYPKGFSFEDSIFVDKYGRGVETNISYTGGESGYFIRYYDDTSKIFTFSHGFLESLPRWVDDVHVPLVSGKGIPTQAYFTLRQMKILEIPNAGIELVRMTQIQNLETMGYIAKIIKNNNLTDITKVNILEAPSMNYVKTTMQQAGYELKQGKIISNKNTEAYTGSELRSAGFKINEEFLNRHNLKMNDKLFINFDIKIQVKPIK